jgi:subtilase family protein
MGEWKVHIISMSFLFLQPQDSIREVIEYAHSKRVLVFAAASNNKHNESNPVGFPARLDKVIGAYSCTHQNQRSHFSPDPSVTLSNQRPKFAVIGEHLSAAFPMA